MDRDILFRGKRISDGEWVYGHYLEDKRFNSHIIFGFINDKMNYNELEIMQYEVDPKTVGQYTGMKDRNGTRIFEDDIIEVKSELCSNFGRKPTGTFDIHTIKVIWYKTGWGYEQIYNKRWNKHWNLKGDKSDIILECLKYYEVIDNIYDNPELLKQKIKY